MYDTTASYKNSCLKLPSNWWTQNITVTYKIKSPDQNKLVPSVLLCKIMYNRMAGADQSFINPILTQLSPLCYYMGYFNSYLEYSHQILFKWIKVQHQVHFYNHITFNTWQANIIKELSLEINKYSIFRNRIYIEVYFLYIFPTFLERIMACVLQTRHACILTSIWFITW